MGLDSFFRKSRDELGVELECDLPKFDDPQPSLCGGMFSGHGFDGSFRGKVYAELVEDITGVSLYSEWIDNDIVKLMADKLDAACQRQEYVYGDSDLYDLARVFRAFADAGYSLTGWW